MAFEKTRIALGMGWELFRDEIDELHVSRSTTHAVECDHGMVRVWLPSDLVTAIIDARAESERARAVRVSHQLAEKHQVKELLEANDDAK